MTELSDAVEALTEPVVEATAIIGDDGKWVRAHSTTLPPLLQQLADRVHPSGIPDGAAGKLLPAERSLADVNALFEFAKMSAAIRSWCRIRKVPVTRHPVDVVADLRTWGVSAVSDSTLDGRFYVRELTRWAARITAILHPGESFEADYPCPICKTSAWGDAIDGGSTRAILVSYQKDDRGRVFDQRAVCRAGCGTVWVGHDSLMELAEEQHETRI